MSLPLENIRVIELGSLVAAPYAAALFAQFGAEVIKVEPPETGDPLRKWRKLHKGTSYWWYIQSRNKKSITLNLKSPEARDIVLELVRRADVVIENFRPGTLEAWGLGWSDLSAVNPSLIMLRISGYGQTGPYRDRPGFAAVAEAIGGLRYVTGFPDRPPVRTGVSLGDTLASLYGTIGALIALRHVKDNRGAGQYIDVALYESVFAIMESLVPEYAALGHERERTGSSLPGISPSNTYACSDGRYVVIAGNGDGIFRRLMQAIDRSDLADDQALAHNDGRVAQNARLDAAITDFTSRHALDQVLKTLEAAEVPCSSVYSAADIFADAHYRARQMIETRALPDGSPIALPGIVPKLSATPGATRWVGPDLGEHTREILATIGVDDEGFDRLKAAGVV
jgi:crotonobetainyl-CoA:carnitine CoA-transferase CaiB-like acyl-CoA transferase